MSHHRTAASPLGKTATIHAIRPIQWYDECATTDPRFVEAVSTALAVPAPDRTPEQACGLPPTSACHQGRPTPLFHVEEEMPEDFQHWVGRGHGNPIGVPHAICEDGQGHLNMDDLDIWLWYRVIVPKTHAGLFKRLVWRDIFLTQEDSQRLLVMLSGSCLSWLSYESVRWADVGLGPMTPPPMRSLQTTSHVGWVPLPV